MFGQWMLRGLIMIAIALTRIALWLRIAILLTPDRWRTSKSILERARKRLARAEADGNRGSKHGKARLRGESHRCHFHSSTTQVVAQGLSHPSRKEPMEVVGRKVCDLCKGRKIERPVELAVNKFQNPVHTAVVHGATIRRVHFNPEEFGYAALPRCARVYLSDSQQSVREMMWNPCCASTILRTDRPAKRVCKNCGLGLQAENSAVAVI